MCEQDLQRILTQLYRDYQPAMLNRAYRRVGSMSDAEDIVSNCWVSLIGHAQHLNGLEDKARSTYIMRSLDNKITDFLRISARQKRQPLDERTMSVEGVDGALQQSEASEDRMLRLTKREREVVHLRCTGLRLTEVAKLLNLSSSTARVYWLRAVKKLRENLNGQE